MTPDNHRPAFCLWREECSLFKACAHSDDSGTVSFCPTYKGPWCGHFIAKEREESKKEKA
jgi:hypothetical protein